MNLDDNFWQQIYETPFHLTKNSKVLMVQYKIIHHILAINRNLKKWGKTTSSECEYCGKEETIEHFIYECVNTNPLWNSINTWWKNAFDFLNPHHYIRIHIWCTQ